MKLTATLFAIALPAAALAGDAPQASAPEGASQVGEVSAMPSYVTPPDAWRSVEDAVGCHDRITQVRKEAGLPEIERQPASPDKPLMIWAVDRQQDGCAVMVVKGNPADIRPLPAPSEGPLFRQIPAHQVPESQ